MSDGFHKNALTIYAQNNDKRQSCQTLRPFSSTWRHVELRPKTRFLRILCFMRFLNLELILRHLQITVCSASVPWTWATHQATGIVLGIVITSVHGDSRQGAGNSDGEFQHTMVSLNKISWQTESCIYVCVCVYKAQILAILPNTYL